MDFSIVKRHPYAIGGTVVGLIVLWLLLRHSSSGGSASSSSGPSPADLQLAQLNAGAGIQNSQIQAGVQVAQTQADVVNNQTAAALTASELTTAAQLQLGLHQQDVQFATAVTGDQTSVDLANIQANVDITKTQIQGNTIEDVAAIQGQTQVQIEQAQTAVALTQVQDVNSQISNLMKYSKHFSQDIKAIAPTIAFETGQGSAAPGVASAQAAENISKSPSAIIGAAAKGISGIAAALFG
jgi:hypothetical protein